MKTRIRGLLLFATTMLFLSSSGYAQDTGGAQDAADQAVEQFRNGRFRWEVSKPVVTVNPSRLPESPENPWLAVKDPTVVRYNDRWHLFCTLRKQNGGDGKPPGYIRIGYLSFDRWENAAMADWRLIRLSLGYHAAPQVFYYAPHQKWYLVYQLEDEKRGIKYGPCYSTTETIDDPDSWSLPTPFYATKPDNVKGWLDFWIICDEQSAHLFFTSLNGTLWRSQTKLANFPHGFGNPVVALRGKFFEASHTYRLSGSNLFLTLIEAQGKSGGRGRRFYKAYVSNSLNGSWQELAASNANPFAGGANVLLPASSWTDSISHGEMIRTGFDQKLEVDPGKLKFLFQGIRDENWGRGYGKLGWQLGLLSPVLPIQQ